MINEDFIEFKYYTTYLSEKANIDPNSIVFISESGQERLIANGVEYFLVPSDGLEQQVLKKTINGPMWSYDKEVNTARTKNITDIPHNVNIFIPGLDSTVSNRTLSVNQDMVEGHECHIIVDNYTDVPQTIAIPDGGKYVNLSPFDTMTVNPGECAEINILSAGGKLYIRAIN